MPTRRSAKNPTKTLKSRCGSNAGRHGEPHIVQRAAGQQIGGDESPGAVERTLAKRQEAGAAEQQIEAEAENSPNENTREKINRAEPGVEDEWQNN